MVARVALGLFAALAIIGGAMLTAMVAIYFWGDDFVPVLHEYGGWGILAGAAGLGVYVGGVIPAHPAIRALVGAGAAAVGLGVTSVVSMLVSLTADRGGPRGNLEDGSHGIIWMIAGLCFVGVLATPRWPVRRD